MAEKPPRKRNQQDTRTRLLKAALDVFSKEGYDAATTRGIAKKAGVNESLIHRYFKSKLGLFFTLKQQFRENLLKQFLAYEESESLEEELCRFLKSRLQLTKQDKKIFKLVVSRAILDPKVREVIKSYAHMRPPELVERFERFRRKGQIRADLDLEQLVGVIYSLAFAFSLQLDAIGSLQPEEAEVLMRTSAAMLSHGLMPRAGERSI